MALTEPARVLSVRRGRPEAPSRAGAGPQPSWSDRWTSRSLAPGAFALTATGSAGERETRAADRRSRPSAPSSRRGCAHRSPAARFAHVKKRELQKPQD